MQIDNLSLVIPIHNEALGLTELIEEINEVLASKLDNLEYVLVDDGSTDNTQDLVEDLKGKYQIKYLRNLKNCGQGLALMRGIKSSSQKYIMITDGDLQVCPKDMLKVINYFEVSDVDFICTKRKKRTDEPFKGHLLSALGNFIISLFFNTDFSDICSPIKLIAKADISDLKPFKNIHRYINIILYKKNLRFEEVTISFRSRKHGRSHYSLLKFIRVLWEILYLNRYMKQISSCAE